MAIIAAGERAPEFTLASPDGVVTRADLEGKRTLLVFYPFAFSSVCTNQLGVYNDLLGDFSAQGLTLYGVSCDAVASQQAFKEQLGIEIEQLSDFEPKGAACRAFGVYHPGGFPQRALVLIGSDGTVEWSYEADSPGEAASWLHSTTPSGPMSTSARCGKPPGCRTPNARQAAPLGSKSESCSISTPR